MNAIEELTRLLKKLPGMGEKSASRLSYYLIRSDSSYNRALSKAIGELQDKIHPCPICGCYTEYDECEYCSSTKRDRSLLCIVEMAQDVLSIANAGIYNGLFHVLGGAIDPLSGVTPDKLSFAALEKRINEGEFKEIIIATNPTEEGDTTALYIQHMLKDREGLEITRLASGLPIGGELGYADKVTLARSMRARVKL